MSHAGTVVVLALALACASPEPAAVPRPGGPYVATRPEAFHGRVIGAWREGVAVRGNPIIEPGTAIATFGSHGSYTSESGNHTAIYLSQDDRGIWVYDQRRGQPVQKRLIPFEGGSGAKRRSKSNDGKRFAVIE